MCVSVVPDTKKKNQSKKSKSNKKKKSNKTFIHIFNQYSFFLVNCKFGNSIFFGNFVYFVFDIFSIFLDRCVYTYN